VRQVVQLLDVHRDDLAVGAHKVEQLRVKISRAAAVRTALDNERRLHVVDRFLRDPKVKCVLPNRFAKPVARAEVVCLGESRQRICCA